MSFSTSFDKTPMRGLNAGNFYNQFIIFDVKKQQLREKKKFIPMQTRKLFLKPCIYRQSFVLRTTCLTHNLDLLQIFLHFSQLTKVILWFLRVCSFSSSGCLSRSFWKVIVCLIPGNSYSFYFIGWSRMYCVYAYADHSRSIESLQQSINVKNICSS